MRRRTLRSFYPEAVGTLAEMFTFESMRFEKHVFICTNERAPGGRPSCGEACGMELVKLFKKAIKDRGLKGRMRAQRAGCLDACEHGPSVVVYPEGVFYGGVKPEHVDEIVEQHLIQDRPVERLIIDFSKDTPSDD